MIDLQSKRFRDQVMGCWMGKNCGGTLGTPLEKCFGEEEPFNINWYPKLEPGGMPNDDLEMQLVWLKALEEVGPQLTAQDMAQYWLDYIGYNFDEYGLSKTNLRLGLRPPVSGAYNNWFVDCMGCPIRSEIWASVAPGAPRTAVRLSYSDAICDHAGGESVWGEFFNTAMGSAAFVESDLNKLLDIGRSYVPNGTATAKAIDTARKAYKAGVDWKEARKRVLKATPHYVAQYSPINMGIQVIGLLYGKGFGHMLCLTVNCGYDTDCTGATVGSIIGTVKGYSRLPKKWTDPLGDKLKTNASWGGLKHVYEGSNPIPKDLHKLTDRVISVAEKVLAGADTSKKSLMADKSIFNLVLEPPMSVFFPAKALDVRIDYGDDPVIVPGKARKVKTVLENSHSETLCVTAELDVPRKWQVRPRQKRIEVPARSQAAIEWTVSAPVKTVRNSNHLTLKAIIEKRPAPPAVPVVLIGARAYRIMGPYALPAGTKDPLKLRKGPETGKVAGKIVYAQGNNLPAEWFKKPGIYYLKGRLEFKRAMPGALRVSANCPSSIALNGKPLVEAPAPGPVRPNLGGTPCRFKRGKNEMLIKIVVSRGVKADIHVILDRGRDRLSDGLIEGEWTQA